MAKKTAKKAVRKTTPKVSAGAAGNTRRKKAPARPKRLSVSLRSQSGIRDVAEIYAELSQVVDHPGDVVIHAHEVSRIDAAIMQTITAFVRTRREAGRNTRWNHGPSEAFLRAARMLALEGELSLDSGGGGS